MFVIDLVIIGIGITFYVVATILVMLFIVVIIVASVLRETIEVEDGALFLLGVNRGVIAVNREVGVAVVGIGIISLRVLLVYIASSLSIGRL